MQAQVTSQHGACGVQVVCKWCANGVQDAQKNRSLHQAQARDGALGITGWVGILGMFTLSFF